MIFLTKEFMGIAAEKGYELKGTKIIVRVYYKISISEMRSYLLEIFVESKITGSI